MDQGSKLMTMRWRTWIVVSALSVAPGCNGTFLVKMAPAIRGSGIAKEETRPVEAFHALEAGNALQVTVAVTKDAKAGLKISGDDNLVPLVESEVRDGALILRIKADSNISTKLPLLAEVTTGELDRVNASGASKVTVKGGSKVDRFTAEASGAARVFVEGLETPKAVASATGASHVMLSGTAESLKADASGASQVKAEELKVDDAEVSISGASGIALRASKSVGGDVSGASHLDLHGRPSKNTVSTSGASRVNEKE
jgi:Putative auto-transporter adhesin, head GIN domain